MHAYIGHKDEVRKRLRRVEGQVIPDRAPKLCRSRFDHVVDCGAQSEEDR